MAKSKISVALTINGDVILSCGDYSERVQMQGKSPNQKLESIRWALLNAGFVFDRKTEKLVRKKLNL